MCLCAMYVDYIPSHVLAYTINEFQSTNSVLLV